MDQKHLEDRLAELCAARSEHGDQELGLLACREALGAAARGNGGVGAVLIDPKGAVIERGQNEAFYPNFRSDRHAEMVVMNAFEARCPTLDNMRGHTLVSSLEPCPMCVARLLITGVETVKFLALDELGEWRRTCTSCRPPGNVSDSGWSSSWRTSPKICGSSPWMLFFSTWSSCGTSSTHASESLGCESE